MYNIQHSYTLLVGKKNGATTLENCLEVSLNVKPKFAI